MCVQRPAQFVSSSGRAVHFASCVSALNMATSLWYVNLVALVTVLSGTLQSPLPSVYVYDSLPKRLTEDVVYGAYQEKWLSDNPYKYEADLWLHWQVMNSPARTWDPTSAKLFYIPVLPTRFLHMTLSPSVNWHEAVNKSGEYLREALGIIQQQPYWARTNGRDHFFTITADSARCTHLNALPRSVWGDVSIVQHLGDLVLRENGWPCYDPDADILLPGFLPQDAAPLTPVFGKDRQISVLYRFGTSGPTAGHKYHSRLVRSELRKQFEESSVPFSEWTAGSVNDTLQDMTNATFCVCPPGVVAHTSRFWRSLRRGCIPVTFFRAYELPFSRAIDYSVATVNIQPDNIATMSSVLTDILNNPAKLLSLQRNVEKVQNMIVWEGQGYSSSVKQLFWDELSRRSARMYKYAVGDTYT